MPREYRTYTIDDYEVTRDGTVINKHTGRVLKAQKNGKGYLRVGIGGKLYFVHRLVAERYVPNPENKPQVNHKDGDKLNNCADNLEWVTNLQNRQHAIEHGLHVMGEYCPWAKLTQDQVCFIREHTEFEPNVLAKIFNVSPRTIKDVWKHYSWKH